MSVVNVSPLGIQQLSGVIPLHHTTHEQGGADVIQNVAWTNAANVFTVDQTISKAFAKLVLINGSQISKARVNADTNTFFLSQNFIPTGSNALLDDTAQDGISVGIATNPGMFYVSYIPAGVNPRTSTTIMDVNPTRAAFPSAVEAHNINLVGTQYPNVDLQSLGKVQHGRIIQDDTHLDITQNMIFVLGGNYQLDNVANHAVNLSLYTDGAFPPGAGFWYATAGVNPRPSTYMFTVTPTQALFSGALGMKEMTAPAAPAADSVVIYAEDNGSGKTKLMAKFNTGAAVQIVIQP